METDAQLICVSEDPQAEQRARTLLFTAQHISDEVVLEAMAALGEGKGVSFVDALNAVIAEKVMWLKIPEGSKVVLPTSGVVCRSLRDTERSKEPLASFRDRLAQASDAASVIKNGLELGDRSLHFAAGFLGNKKVRSVMDDPTLDQYACSMASFGYRSALEVAQQRPDLEIGRTVSAAVPGIIRRFRHVVKVLASFTEGERERMQAAYS